MVRKERRGTEELGGAIGCLALFVALVVFVVLTARGCGSGATG